MTWAILRCGQCGRVFTHYYCAHKRVDCTNKSCNNKMWIDEDSMINIKFGTDLKPVEDSAYILINAFNSYAYLCAKVYSQDGGNSMMFPITEKHVGLTRRDTLMAIPTDMKHTTAWDGLVIASGCYPVSPEMEAAIIANKYVREDKNV